MVLGLIHPDELDSRLTDRQYAEWLWYYEEYPFGNWVDNYMRARMCSLQMAEPKPEIEMMPRFAKEQEDLTDSQLLNVIPGGGGAQKFLESIGGNRKDT